ncbi:MAG: hypothetical protein LBU32_06340 [Clostridiales bacterium]|jgi:hypothetical protein|nr:hypothetical protein [Clostridiales bacterium]
MPNEPLNRIQGALSRHAPPLNSKTSILVDISRIKTQISKLRREISFLMIDLGKIAYDSWESGEASPERLEIICLSIKEKNESVKSLNSEIAALELKEASFSSQGSQADSAPSAAIPAFKESPGSSNQAKKG